MGKPPDEVATAEAEAVAEEDRDLDRVLGSAVWTAALVLHMGRRRDHEARFEGGRPDGSPGDATLD